MIALKYMNNAHRAFCKGEEALRCAVFVGLLESLPKYRAESFISQNASFINNNRRGYSSYCLENVKQFDYDNFLATLLLPKLSRDSVFAIRAFNIELAQVKDVTREELTAKMRFQFWRESLDQIYKGKPPNHPLAKALLRAVVKHNLTKKWLQNLVDSREDNLINRPFVDIKALEDYCEKANSTVYYLILQSLGVKDLQGDHAASHMGKSEGIAKFLKGIPFYGSKRIVLIPVPLLASHGVSQQDIIRGKSDQKVKDVVFEIASVAHQHLHHVKGMEGEIPTAAKVAFLPAISVSGFLKTLQRNDFDVFSPNLRKKDSLLPAKLLWGKFRKSYSTS